MSRSPLLTIAIPTLNEEKNLESCLKSVRGQKNKSQIEVIIVDCGSTDRTLEVAKKYGARVERVVLKDPAQNMVIGKMIALKKARGKYFTYLDADIDLPVNNWAELMIKPLEENREIVASFTRFVSYPTDFPLNKYLTLDSLQRDPLFVYITASVESVISSNQKGYSLCLYTKDKIPPMGLCVFRTRQLLETPIGRRQAFFELDNLVILVEKGLNKFAYVPAAGLHHLTVPNLSVLLKKRARNLTHTFFPKSSQNKSQDKRYWTWIDFKDRKSIFKLALWVIYAELLVGPILVGIYKSLKYQTWVGLYEPIVVWTTTNLILYSFLTSVGGREMILKLFK